MISQQRERILWLCNQIAREEDKERFAHLIRELNDLLECEEPRIEPHAAK